MFLRDAAFFKISDKSLKTRNAARLFNSHVEMAEEKSSLHNVGLLSLIRNSDEIHLLPKDLAATR